jgi:phage terminase Nu1 subunit (DNA packaging protein)
MEDFEKLGAFYLGKGYDLEKDKLTEELILYDSKDLTTHAVIIGMTGSGKTGLGIGLLEEAAIDKIPVIAIDPKGDLGNILLTFPGLSGEDFAPWIDPQEAAKDGSTVAQYGENQARLWKKGLADWGQTPDRIQRLRDSVDMAIYTPGSAAGLPISVLKSFTAPPAQIRGDGDLYRERILSTATSILALLDIEGDPLTSREHILIANILQHRWDEAQDLDLPGLIAAIQQPPIERVGVMDINSFFPPKERVALAMRINNLLAAPGFGVWMEGEPMDAGRLLYTSSGQPRVSVVSIAHLSDSERMFFVTMLLNEVISWMRRQPGTGSLRAILYMDEIFGYLPPIANPPSKTLFLSLLKQARAYGVGLVLATQNPVDLDYKGLSNTGTWFIGRLQTERDKARVMDGLEGVAAGQEFDKQKMERILAGLGKRRFLLHNVHETAPAVFGTRWVMSYLSGPLTRDQIKNIMAGRTATVVTAPEPTTSEPGKLEGGRSNPPILPPSVSQYYLPVLRRSKNNADLIYHAQLIGAADVGYSSARYKVNTERRIVALTEIIDDPLPVDWEDGAVIEVDPDELESSGIEEAVYGEIATPAMNEKNYGDWKKLFMRWIRNAHALTLYRSPTYKAVSKPSESEGDFRARLQVLAHEKRDIATGKLRKKYDAKVTTLENRLMRAQQRIATEEAQSKQTKLDAAIAVGAAVLGAFLGRKRVSAATATKVGSAVKRAGRLSKETGDVARARETAQAVGKQLQELNREFENELADLDTSFDAQAEALDEIIIKSKMTDVHVHLLGVAWVPYYRSQVGKLTRAWS